ncbi:anti-repressor SinI family protein [Bacillus sp. EB600]|nr:anti-repressor SinI family protein [Bacillus sp. EB600]
MLEANTISKDMDAEWLELILEAKKIGITIEEVREFLDQNA